VGHSSPADGCGSPGGRRADRRFPARFLDAFHTTANNPHQLARFPCLRLPQSLGWRVSLERPDSPGHLAHACSGSTGEPVILGYTLYIITDNRVSALDAQTGTLRWAHDFQGRVVDPYLDNGLLYFRSLFPLPSALYAVNPVNGALIATYTPLAGQKGWNSPIVVSGVLYYLWNSTLYALQLPGEKLIWQQPIVSGELFDLTTITVVAGVVYVSIGGKVLPYSLIEAFAAHTGSKLWQSPPLTRGSRQVFATDELIYTASLSGGELLAFNTHTHALVWRKPLGTFSLYPLPLGRSTLWLA
jgi:outer membrane protein assembly factor BamB